jgi:3-oxoacyl-[acyl-carrier protein] reductase
MTATIDLRGTIAIVTGASRSQGIGTAVCRTLAAAGADIFFTHWEAFDAAEGNGREVGWPERLCEELQRMGVRAAHMEADLTDSEMPERILDQAEATLGGTPAILINNAAFCAPTEFRSMDAHELDSHYAVNNRGTILLSTAFARRFEEKRAGHRDGRIIFLVSKGPDPLNLAYIATKGALIALTEPLATALAPVGITVNAVDPGPTDSGWITDEMREYFLPQFPMGRIGIPEDAAKLIRFLASEDAGWITGQHIKSEGGFLGK